MSNYTTNNSTAFAYGGLDDYYGEEKTYGAMDFAADFAADFSERAREPYAQSPFRGPFAPLADLIPAEYAPLLVIPGLYTFYHQVIPAIKTFFILFPTIMTIVPLPLALLHALFLRLEIHTWEDFCTFFSALHSTCKTSPICQSIVFNTMKNMDILLKISLVSTLSMCVQLLWWARKRLCEKGFMGVDGKDVENVWIMTGLMVGARIIDIAESAAEERRRLKSLALYKVFNFTKKIFYR